ncbi:MAG: endonuclease III [Candidatus Riflebacteria bacterium]|nr:endonuclease III [Candidatus Riflebacteria bacterium]
MKSSRGSPDWLRARSGPLSTRDMCRALERIAAHLRSSREGSSAELALEKVARRRDPFHVLVACIISLRTKDEVTDTVAPRLLERAPTPDQLVRLDEEEIARLIYPAGFYRTKARSLREISRRLLKEFQGQVPSEIGTLLTLPGVGRKTANLVVSLGHGAPGICVDTHVHRFSNRIGYASTREPDETELVLRSRLPGRWWTPINELIVSFGRQLCTPVSPHCSCCPVRSICLRVGVTRSR